MFRVDLGKYRTIVLSIALFLIFDLGVLVLNFVISSQISRDAENVNLAGRQRMLSQRIAKTALQVENRLAAGNPHAAELKELSQAATTFDRTLNAFVQGGGTSSGAGAEIVVAAIDDAAAQDILRQAQAQWGPLAESIQHLTGQATPSAEASANLARRAEAANLTLLKLMNDLTTRVEQTAAAKATTLRMVQLGGISLATINFIVILFHFIGHLRRSDRALERARKETDDILRTTQEGLFLLDTEYTIGSQHSRALGGIVGVPALAGRNFLELLKPLVSEKTLTTAREYLELLLKHDVKEKLVSDLNPLNCVQIIHRQENGKAETRYLEFAFNRVKEGDKITHLLATANDITRRIKLERELKESEDRARGQMGILIEIMQVEPPALEQFLRTANEGLQNLNQLLQAREAAPDARMAKVHALFRQTHRIKGDAAALGLKNIAAGFEQLENTLANLREQASLAGEDFLPVIVQVKTLFEQIDSIETAVAHISQVRGVATVEPTRPQHDAGNAQLPFVRQWQAFAAEIAARRGNAAEVSYHGMDIAALPQALQDALGTLINQFIRNAVVHGIESPAERKAQGKPAAGRLSIYVSPREDGGVELSFRDDGRGIDVERIRAAAVTKGRLTAAEAASWDYRRIVGLIFEPGMSTASTVDGDAGRGAGLDAVRDLVARLRGGIRIGTTAKEYAHFRVSLAAPRREVMA